ncbi:MAG: c-type cytochrome [Anaerolineae bacterium]|jgi:mono/diheme cytochrome c family protein|nr:c-type cytochrome [Anaerolineae bacterium]MBT7069686.1 c-type cytochrome [Anaerolineae bacterium]MBT7323626.1 c-type cytochrome [Anaerolineae bacterium]MBT7601810.1 c-type cytochrome [Anaerolineae bacterium]
MTTSMKLTGFLATLIILVVIPAYSWIEPTHQENLLDNHYTNAVLSSTDLYAENCTVCHGAAGEGIGDTPPLNSEAVRTMSENDLSKVISRGRNNTLMAAWAAEEGGIFSNSQISDFTTFIQQANWDYVEARVAELGLTPPDVIKMEVSDEMVSSILALPDGERLSEGLFIYADNCAACHGANGSGTIIAPAIDSADLRTRPKEEIINLVNSGINGTLMASWQNILAPEEINATVDLIYRWPELIQTGIDFPEVEVMSIPSSPELIADGQQLFNIACKSCHGVDGYGSPMAPALNNQLFLEETPDAAIYQIIAGGVSGTLMPAWGSRLNDYDLQSLVAFLRSVEETAPSILPPILGK